MTCQALRKWWIDHDEHDLEKMSQKFREEFAEHFDGCRRCVLWLDEFPDHACISYEQFEEVFGPHSPLT